MGQKLITAAANKVKDGDAVILDIRTCQEFWSGFLCGAQHVPTPLPPLNEEQQDVLYYFLRNYNRANPDKIFIVYCKKGIRSGIAEEMLKGMGAKVIDLGGVEKEPLKSIMTGKVQNMYLRVCGC